LWFFSFNFLIKKNYTCSVIFFSKGLPENGTGDGHLQKKSWERPTASRQAFGENGENQKIKGKKFIPLIISRS